jgi:hypothetical protein
VESLIIGWFCAGRRSMMKNAETKLNLECDFVVIPSLEELQDHSGDEMPASRKRYLNLRYCRSPALAHPLASLRQGSRRPV